MFFETPQQKVGIHHKYVYIFARNFKTTLTFHTAIQFETYVVWVVASEKGGAYLSHHLQLTPLNPR